MCVTKKRTGGNGKCLDKLTRCRLGKKARKLCRIYELFLPYKIMKVINWTWQHDMALVISGIENRFIVELISE